MKSAFLTEMGFEGQIPPNHPNMRTEFAWMFTLGADHYNIHSYGKVKGYDVVFIIFPKSTVKLNAVGVEMTGLVDKDMSIYSKPVVEVLKINNKKVCNVQEGPSWFFNDYDLPTQFHFYNQLSECDILFAHNHSDVVFYRGLFNGKKVAVIPSLMIGKNISDPIFVKEPKTIIGGNFARWYGGFQSYIVASTFNCPIYVPSSHCKRDEEEQVPNLNHLPWVSWIEWIAQLSTFKYAVNLMPTVAAGTFSMNCAYWGIPCIGNKEVDTQNGLFPTISVEVNDVSRAVKWAERLVEDKHFYDGIAEEARWRLRDSYHFNQMMWLNHMERVING